MEIDSKVSIIVPIYNAESYLCRCLESIINQTYKNIEVICVNDGSSDNSLKIVMDYQKRDKRIVLINQTNSGVSYARNIGLEQVTGNYVMFVDSDDWISHEMVKELIHEAESSKAQLVMCGYCREFENRTKEKRFDLQNRVVYTNEELNKLHRKLFGPLACELGNPETLDALGTVWAKLYDILLIKNNNIKFIDLDIIGSNEDGLFNIMVFEQLKKAVFINKPLYHYWKQNTSSITSKYNPDLPHQWSQLFKYLKKHIITYKKGSDYEDALKNRRCISVLGLGLNECFNTKQSYFKKVSNWKKILNDEEIKEAYRDFNSNVFPIHWKLFYQFNKKRWAYFSFMMIIGINFLRKRV